MCSHSTWDGLWSSRLLTGDACCFDPSLPQDGNHTTMMNQPAPSKRSVEHLSPEYREGSPLLQGKKGFLEYPPPNLHALRIQSLGSWTVIFGPSHLDDAWLFLEWGSLAHISS